MKKVLLSMHRYVHKWNPKTLRVYSEFEQVPYICAGLSFSFGLARVIAWTLPMISVHLVRLLFVADSVLLLCNRSPVTCLLLTLFRLFVWSIFIHLRAQWLAYLFVRERASVSSSLRVRFALLLGLPTLRLIQLLLLNDSPLLVLTVNLRFISLSSAFSFDCGSLLIHLIVY